jgi:hypothetical protein
MPELIAQLGKLPFEQFDRFVGVAGLYITVDLDEGSPRGAGGNTSPKLSDRAIGVEQMILSQHRHRPRDSQHGGGILFEHPFIE